MTSESYPVVSSAIAKMNYDKDTGELTFTMQKGQTYTITIPEIEVYRWANSDSPGHYFNNNIKGKYL